MATTTWVNPNPPGGFVRKQDIIVVDSSVAPAYSPAPAGNAIVPAGYIKQIGNDAVDTLWLTVNGVVESDIFKPGTVYFTGGWPPDPLNGQPFHTAQRPTGAG